MVEDFNKKLVELEDSNQGLEEDEEEEEKPQCEICNDSGQIEHGYWEEEHDEFIVTKYSICECSQD